MFSRMPKKSAIVLIFAAILSLFIAGCSGGEDQAPPPAGVRILTLERQDIPLRDEFVGQTAGYREVEVRAQVGGILLRRAYTEGEIVEMNQLMFQLDPAPYQAALAQAKGTLAQAEALLYQTKLDNDRFIRLYKEEAVSRKERDDAVAAYRAALGDAEAARAQVENAEINLGYTTVLAPIKGAASEENLSEGNLISVGQVLTKIVQIDPLYVNFSIPSSDALRYRDLLSRGLLEAPPDNRFDVDIRLSDGSMHSGQGVVNFIAPLVDPPTSSIRARAVLENPGSSVLPGQFARVFMEGYTLKGVLVVPQRAVINTQSGPVIYVLDEKNQVKAVPFELEMALGSDYIMKNGGEPGDRVIVEGIQKVRPGSFVEILNGTNSTSPESN